MKGEEVFNGIHIFRYGSTVNPMESRYMNFGMTAGVIIKSRSRATNR